LGRFMCLVFAFREVDFFHHALLSGSFSAISFPRFCFHATFDKHRFPFAEFLSNHFTIFPKKNTIHKTDFFVFLLSCFLGIVSFFTLTTKASQTATASKPRRKEEEPYSHVVPRGSGHPFAHPPNPPSQTSHGRKEELGGLEPKDQTTRIHQSGCDSSPWPCPSGL